jgi:hypothetical protein
LLREPVEKWYPTVPFTPNATVGKKTKNNPPRLKDAMNLGESGVDVFDVLHDLIVDDQIEHTVGKWDHVTLHREDDAG